MADGNFKINRGVTLGAQSSVPTNPVSGDIYYDSTANTFIYYDNGQWINLASSADVASATTLNSVQFTALVVQNSFVRITGSTASNLYGLAASTNGKQLIIYNVSSVSCTIANQSATELVAANRIITMSGSSVTLQSGQMAMFVYDANQSRWICDPFQPASTVANTYPNLYVTNETDLAGAIATASSDGGSVICLLNSFTISSNHIIPVDTTVIGRKGFSVITVLSGGSLTCSNYVTMRNVYMTTALSSGTMLTLNSLRSIVDDCKFRVPSSSSTVCINVSGSINLIKDSTFIGVQAPSTGVGIEYQGAEAGNVDSNCLFQS